MYQRKIEGFKHIGSDYKIIRPLFQVKGYMYAQICLLKKANKITTAALYLYENEDPTQSLKMLKDKLDIDLRSQTNNLIFPYQHFKQSQQDKHISIYLLSNYLIPLRFYEKRQLSISQTLQILHGALASLNQLHTRQVLHGNISLATCYLVKQKHEPRCRFALNILDTVYFTEEDCCDGLQDKLFQSEGQSLGLKLSYKDDLESLVYVMAHLLSRGKMFTLQRFQLEWLTQAELLRWKSCDFFRELVKQVPPQLSIIVEIYTIAKSMRRNQRPDYLKLMKKVLGILSAFQSNQLHEQSIKCDENYPIDQDQVVVSTKSKKLARKTGLCSKQNNKSKENV